VESQHSQICHNIIDFKERFLRGRGPPGGARGVTALPQCGQYLPMHAKINDLMSYW